MMMGDERLALFMMLGQGASRTVRSLKDLAPSASVMLSPSYDLATVMPDAVRRSAEAAEAYKLFFVFETYLRDFVVDMLSQDPAVNWWERVPLFIRDEVKKLEETEEVKAWMALASRDRSALMTYQQLLAVMDDKDNWKAIFEPVVHDKTLVQAARTIAHLRNTICHMTEIPEDEVERVRRTMRDWFRVVAP